MILTKRKKRMSISEPVEIKKSKIEGNIEEGKKEEEKVKKELWPIKYSKHTSLSVIKRWKLILKESREQRFHLRFL